MVSLYEHGMAAAPQVLKRFSSGSIVVGICLISQCAALTLERSAYSRHPSDDSASAFSVNAVNASTNRGRPNILDFGTLLQVPRGAVHDQHLLKLFGDDSTFWPSYYETSVHSGQCYEHMRGRRNDASYKPLRLTEVCQPKQRRPLPDDALGIDQVAFVLPLYGESIFDDHNQCAVCVAVLSLLCSGPEDIPIIVMHTPEVSKWELQMLSSVFAQVELLEVERVALSPSCKEQAEAVPRLQNVLMKIWYWGLTDFKQVMVLDNDVLVVNNVDDMLTHPLEARIGASHDVGTMRCPKRGHPYGTVHRVNANSNGGVVVAKPSRETLVELFAGIPKMEDCSSLVEQTLLWETFKDQVELPAAYNCRHTAIHRCCEEEMPIKIMHFAGPVKAWGPELAPDFWRSGNPAMTYLRMWHYLHYQLMQHLCPSK